MGSNPVGRANYLSKIASFSAFPRYLDLPAREHRGHKIPECTRRFPGKNPGLVSSPFQVRLRRHPRHGKEIAQC